MSTFVQLVVSGLALGAVYALVALGFVVIYRSSKVFNFAQGEFLAIGALTMTTLCGAGVPWGLALVLALLVTGAVGAFVERVALRRMVGKPVFVTIILTIFVGFILRTLTHVVWGAEDRGMPTPWETTGVVTVGGASVLHNSLAAVAAAGAAVLGFFYLVRFTRLGLAMRATSVDQETSLSLGIPVGRIFQTAWFIAGALAALGGIFLSMFPRYVDANLGFIALRAFPAVIVGGLDSAVGAVAAGLALGVLEQLAQGYVNPRLGSFGLNFHEVFPYIIMIAFLVIRPHGLFGKKDVERL